MNYVVRIELLGKLRIVLPDREITRFRTRKTGALLAYLAYHCGQPVSRETLMDMLWPELDSSAGRNNLSTALSSLRHQLEPPDVAAGTVIVADRDTITLNAAACRTDVQEFVRSLQRSASTDDPVFRIRLLESALALYSVPLLPHEDEVWIEGARLELQQANERALVQLQSLREAEQNIRAVPVGRLPVLSPPVGTVTFLMLGWADLHALRARAGSTFGATTAAYQAVVQSELRRWGGFVCSVREETFLVAFSSAEDACQCALAFPGALAAQLGAGRREEYLLRIVLDTGEATWEEVAYRSATLAQVAWMLASAHGGQTLCAETTVTLLRRNSYLRLQWKDLGLYQSESEQSPERLFQLDPPGVPPGEFPPLSARRAHTNTIPVPATRFFGRESEIAALIPLLLEGKTRLLTLTGTGGTGKTRLSIELGRRIQSTFPGLVWFAPLADVTEAHLLPDALARVLNLPFRSASSLSEQISAFLNSLGTPLLLILDNFEQLVEGGADFVQELLDNVPQLACLLTSRHSLNTEDEREWHVLPLPLPQGEDRGQSKKNTEDKEGREPHASTFLQAPSVLSSPAVQLFVDRAQAVKSDFQLTPANAGAIAQLCTMLEGIPLAIELATARAQMMTPSEMLAALEHRFEFLAGRRRRAVPRHQTLRAAIDWSYERLSPELQRCFVHLSVFRDGWTIEAAQAVCEETRTGEHLRELRDGSLLRTDEQQGVPTMRFHMLETLREYGAEKLPEEEVRALRHRHLAYFLQFAEAASPQLHGSKQAAWLQRLEGDYANLRAALEWSLAGQETAEAALRLAGALWPFFQVRGYLSEGRRYLKGALCLPASKTSDETRVSALNGAGALAQMQGDYEEARDWYAQCLEIWEVLEQPQGIASALNNLGLVSELQSDYDQARRLYERSLAIRQQCNDRSGLAASYQNLGILAFMQHDYETARRWYERSLDLKRELKQDQGVAATLNNLGNTAHALGDYAASQGYHEESLAIRQRLGDRPGIAGSLNNLGMVAEKRGELEAARTLYQRSLALKTELGDRLGVATTLRNLGNLACRQGDLAAARAFCFRSLHLLQEMGDRQGIAGTLQTLAEIACSEPQAKRATRLYAAYQTLCDELGIFFSPAEQAEKQQVLTELRAVLGNPVFDVEWTKGAGMTQEQAVTYALSGRAE